MFRQTHIVVAITIASTIVPSAHALIFVTGGSIRSVHTATGGASDSKGSKAAGDFSELASSSGVSRAGAISAIASQDSFVPDPIGVSMTGIGSGSVLADATGATGFSVLSSSEFLFTFQVTTTQIYQMDAEVSWLGDALPPFNGFSRVRLIDLTNSTTPFDVMRGAGAQGTSILDMNVPLFTGVTYRVFAESQIDGGFATAGLYEASAGWKFDLRVPEPDSGALCLIGIAGVTGTMRRRRSRPG
jgi:hypothetical protein